METVIHTTDDAEAARLKVIARTGEALVRDLDSFLMAAYNIYDVGRAIPHPYDAISGMGSKFLHDFRGFASTMASYVKLVENELSDGND
jgi:hypothetical protein